MTQPLHSTTPMEQLIKTLDLEQLEVNLFRGTSPQVGWQRVFGGQVIAQALVAAQRCVDSNRYVHSLHAYFMRPGDPDVPIVYEVERIRDGASLLRAGLWPFSTARRFSPCRPRFNMMKRGWIIR